MQPEHGYETYRGSSRLDGKKAIVTGDDSDIGRAVTLAFAREGEDVLISYLEEEEPDAEETTRVVEEAGRKAVRMPGDVRDEAHCQEIVQKAVDEFGRIDVLVNNAGITNDEGQRGVDADLERVREALETNLFGAWRLCEVAVPLMQRHGYGRIVNISTGMAALEDMGGGSPGYRVSKTGLNALTRILASELRGSGILVNSVCPGWVQTDMGGSRAPRPVEEGAEGAVWAATLPNSGPTGGFFRDRRRIPW